MRTARNTYKEFKHNITGFILKSFKTI